MSEKSCIKPFINKVREKFYDGGTLKDAFGQIKPYKNKMDALVVNVFNNFKLPHQLAVNTLTLATIATYEYFRYQGFDLPPTESILEPLAVASISGGGGPETRDLGDGHFVKRYEDSRGTYLAPYGTGPAARGMSPEETSGFFDK
ncbi:MAG: hypothetical protein ABIJ43_02825 [Candidatus Beckwithbacteria bacterium]